LESIEHPFEQADVRPSVAVFHAVDLHESIGDKITDQHACRTERHANSSRNLCD
jgi:hypothetical protein